MDEDLETEWESIKSELYNGGSEWRNIQQPIVQTFDAVSRGLRNTHIKMYDMDRKLTVMATETDRQLATFNTNLTTLNKQLERLTGVVEVQNESLEDVKGDLHALSKRVDAVNLELEGSRLHQSDKLYAHIQQQIQVLNEEGSDAQKTLTTMVQRTGDLERKMSFKANQREVDDVVPFRIEEAANKLQSQLNDLRNEVGMCATKEEFVNLVNNKATVHDVRTLAIEATEKVTRVEMADALNEQIRPVVSAIASLEKAMQFIEEGNKHVKDDVEVLRPICASAAASADAARSSMQNLKRLDETQVVGIVEQMLREKELDVTSLGLQNSLAEYREVLLKDVSAFLESSKEQLREATQAKTDDLRAAVDARVLELAVAVKEAKDSAGRTKNGVKELANNVAKALSKKADKGEMKKFLHEQGEQAANATAASTAAAVSAASALVYGTGPLPQSGSELQTLAALPVREPHSTRHFGNSSGGGSGGNSAPLGERINRVMHDYSAMRGDVDTIERNNKQVRAELMTMQRMVSNLRDMVDKKVGVEDVETGAVMVRGGAGGKGAKDNKKATEDSTWRSALGDVQTALRKSLEEKVTRDELSTAVKKEASSLTTRISNLQREVTTAMEMSSAAATNAVSHDDVDVVKERVEMVEKMQKQLAADLVSGGRWLWTSGTREADGWIPWDVEVQNSSPTTTLWQAGSYSIRARVPGLYKICVAVFTMKPLALQVCLNWEPLLSLQPTGSDPGAGDSAAGHVVQGQGHVIRSSHPAGEVTCVAIDEYISLPAESVLAVRFHAGAPAQAMLTLKKL